MNWFEVVRPARTAAALSAALLVTACGGGGGGDNKDPQASATSQSASVSLAGVASKGLLKSAVVKVYALNADGSVGVVPLATTRTDQTGHYVTPGLTPGALVYIEVTADADTRMADEATGKDLTPSTTFKLRAVKALSSTPGQDLQQVTPFSEMAVAIAEANGGFKPEVIDAANQRVVSYFSYPVLTTEPTFDANNKPTNPAAVNLAAVSALAKNDVFADCKYKATDVAKVECVVGLLSSKGVGDDDLAYKLESAKDDVDYRGTGVVLSVQPQHDAFVLLPVKNGIAEAKALIKNVRSNADKSVADTLTKRFQTVSDQFNEASIPFNDKGQRQVLAAIQAAAVLDNPQRELGPVFRSTFGGIDWTCTLYSTDSTTPASSYTEVKSVSCIVKEGTEYTGSSFSSTGGGHSWSQTVKAHDVKLSKTTTAGSYAVQTMLYTQDVVHHSEWVGTYRQWDVTSAPTPVSSINAAMLTLSPPSNGALYGANMTLKGNLSPSHSKNVKFDDHVRVNLDMTSKAVGDLTRVNVKGDVYAISNELRSATMLVNDGSYLQLRTVTPGDVGAVLADDQSGAAFHLLVSSALTKGASLTGTLEVDLSGFGLAKKTGRGKISFNGKLFNEAGALLFDGKITVTVPKDLVVVHGQAPVATDGSIALDGTLPIPTRPDMVVHLTTTTNRSSVHSFSGSYTQKDFASVLLDCSVDESTSRIISLTLSTPSGVTVTGHPNDEKFDIMKGTDKLGIFTKSDGMIVYADSTYEQF